MTKKTKEVMGVHEFCEIRTDRLLLRQLKQEDALDIFEMRSNAEMILYTDSKLDETVEDTRKYLEGMNEGIAEGKWLIWAMEHKEKGEVIGTVSVWNYDWEGSKAELGFGVNPRFAHQGYMKEALIAVITFAFETMKFRTLEAYTEKGNLNSKRLLSSSSFHQVRQVSEPGYHSERLYVMDVYEITNRSLP